jgi:hypothetical protein
MDKNLQKRLKRRLSLIFMCIFLCFSAWAQTSNITGKVTAADSGQPIPGVNVRIKGSTIGAVTGVDGGYSITAAPGNILVFSYLGFSTQEINVKLTGTIDVKLSPTSSNLNEVVVTGYARTKRKDLTGAISSISGNDLRQTPTNYFRPGPAGQSCRRCGSTGIGATRGRRIYSNKGRVVNKRL